MAKIGATHRFARIAARKVRPFADLIRGKSVKDAVDTLKYLPNRGARLLEAVLNSARANAEQRGARNSERLTVVDAHVDEGPMFKRIQPRARGMAYMVRSRMSHIHVSVDASELG